MPGGGLATRSVPSEAFASVAVLGTDEHPAPDVVPLRSVPVPSCGAPGPPPLHDAPDAAGCLNGLGSR